MALAPLPSAILANSRALTWSSSQPLRNLTVTGAELALTTARMTLSAVSIRSMRALPSPFPVILGAGQPMLMSMRASFPWRLSQMNPACSAMMSGSLPKSWTAQGVSPSPMASREPLRLELPP